VGDPYYALIGEVSKTKEERINLTMMLGIFQVFGAMIAEAGSGFLIGIANFRVMGIALGLLGFATIILTPLFVKEAELAEVEKKPLGIFNSIKKTLANKNFIFYLLPYLGIWFGINILTISMPYICEVLLGMRAEDSGFMIAGAFIVAILFSPFLPKITLKFGKKRVMMAAAFLFAFLLGSIGLFGTIFDKLAATIIMLLVGAPLAAVLVIPNAMVADIAEMDGIENGQRREGMFFGTQGLVMKLVIGLSSLVAPLLFKTFGYSISQPLGLQLCGPIAGLVVLCSILFLKAYTLSEENLETAQRNKGSRSVSN
jgi:GPH family glycoside/pentoside/hexuronide:cation symporter